MSTQDTIITIIILLFLYLAPLIFLLKYYGIKKRSYANFIRVANGTISIYVVIAVLLFIVLCAAGPLIDDPEYPTALDDLILASVILVFIMSVIFIFLPLLLIANIINYAVRKRNPTLR